MKAYGLLLAISFLFGCTTGHAPFVAYDQQVPLAQTSVFMAMSYEGVGMVTQIKKVDGKDTPCWQAGCPLWVRVLPGTHTFLVQYQSNFRVGSMPGTIASNIATLEITVADMLPRHVYQASYSEEGGIVRARILDKGENPDVCINFGYMGCPKARFDEQ